MTDIECPYCGNENDIDHDGEYGYEVDEIFKQECSECYEIFMFYTTISFSYDVHKSPPCVEDDDKHDMQPNDFMINYGYKDAKRCAHEYCDYEDKGIWTDHNQPTKEES